MYLNIVLLSLQKAINFSRAKQRLTREWVYVYIFIYALCACMYTHKKNQEIHIFLLLPAYFWANATEVNHCFALLIFPKLENLER